MKVLLFTLCLIYSIQAAIIVTNQQLEARGGKDEVITLAQDAKSGLTGALGSESMSIDKVLSHLKNQ